MLAEQLGRNSRIVLIACGSFNPPTVLHLRMFERARDFLRQTYGWNVIRGILSPVADNFAKPDLLSASHRLKMCELATTSSSWIRVDGWECGKKQWSRTVDVLDHHRSQLHADLGSDVQLMMICGADLLDSFNTIKADGQRLWEVMHLERILGEYGVVVLERELSISANTLDRLPVDRELTRNVLIVRDDAFPNQLSSTRLRTALKSGQSIRYCTQDSVVDYIQEHHLYAP